MIFIWDNHSWALVRVRKFYRELNCMFLEIFVIGILAGMSPGPDFFIVMKNSLGFGKKIGIASALGIGAALMIHATYTVLGLAVIIETYIYVFKTIQIIGAAYLAYLGVQALLSLFKKEKLTLEAQVASETGKSFWQGFKNGFICNVFNPKAFLFFLSVFSQFFSVDTPKWIEWVYGLEVVMAVTGWFIFLSVMISSKFFRALYQRGHKVLDGFFGGILLYFSYRLSKNIFD